MNDRHALPQWPVGPRRVCTSPRDAATPRSQCGLTRGPFWRAKTTRALLPRAGRRWLPRRSPSRRGRGRPRRRLPVHTARGAVRPAGLAHRGRL